MRLLGKIKQALTKTSSKIGQSIDNLFVNQKLDQHTLEELETILLYADVGYTTSMEIIDTLKRLKFNKAITSEEIKQELSAIIQKILDHENHQFHLQDKKLNIILVCGVNGNGKTTTVGKMAKSYITDGKKVAIAACDTFRAAAIEQVDKWAQRSGATLFCGEENSDPASVAHQAISKSIEQNFDILLIDTAGRLHNHKNLMEELSKIIRVIKKIDNTAPHHSLLVIDGMTGQNAMTQVETFKSVADISGLIITKLDGTAKAGIIINIVQKFKMPIHFVGVGEAIDDLIPFESENFAQSLVGYKE